MKPAFSVVLFTTLAGAAQGLVVVLALLTLGGVPDAVGGPFAGWSLGVAEVLLLLGLAASFGHLGRPERAWRAVLMWRTSWLSREVIALPAFIVLVGGWWLLRQGDAAGVVLPWLGLTLALLLWYCTAMIYACLPFIREWAHPLTFVNFVLVGQSSGLILACGIAALAGAAEVLAITGPAAVVATVLAGVGRWLALRRNAGLVPVSTLQSATGIDAPVLRQTSMGMSAGAFNTREFFHGMGVAAIARVRLVMGLSGFVLPSVLLLVALVSGGPVWYLAASLVQVPGLLAERWLFFAQARHPQNLYYQVVS